MKNLIQLPVKLIRILSDKRNYAILTRALKGESFKEIYVNFLFALSNQGKYHKTNDIKIACNHFKMVNSQLQIKGTVSATIPLSKVQVFFNRKLVHEEQILPFNNSSVHRQHNETFINYSIPVTKSGEIIVRINVIGEGNVHNYFFTKVSNYTLNQYYKSYYKRLAKQDKLIASQIELNNKVISILIYNNKNFATHKEVFEKYKNHVQRTSKHLETSCVYDCGSIKDNLDNLKSQIQNLKSDYVLLLSDRCSYSPSCLGLICDIINKDNARHDIIYGDDDQLTQDDVHINPYFKSDFNQDLLTAFNYIGENFCIKTKVLQNIVPHISNEEDLAYSILLNSISLGSNNFKHIPTILFHYDGNSRHPYDCDSNRQRQSLIKYAATTQLDASITSGLSPYTFRFTRKIKNEPKVTIIIPFKDEVVLLKRCLNSIFNHSVYKNYDIILVNNNSVDRSTLEYLDKIKSHNRIVQILHYPHKFNYSKINNFAVKHTDAEYVLFLNNDTEIINRTWLNDMLEHAQRPDVGAVGAKLLYPDNTIQHAGVIVGIFGVAAHAPKYDTSYEDKHFSRANTIQNLSACTAACLLMKKSIFESCGGFDEEKFPVNFNDVDLCLKLREKNLLIVYTPFAELYHYESKSRGHVIFEKKNSEQTKNEIRNFEEKWKEFISKGDPYYNKHLSLSNRDYSLGK